MSRRWNVMIGMAGTLALAAGAAGCDDERVDPAAPRIDRFFVGEQERAPDAEQLEAVPDDGVLAIDFGRVDVGNLARRYLFLRNTGRSELRLGAVVPAADTSPDFELRCSAGGPLGPCPQQGDAPLTAAPGADLVIELGYGPAEVGPDAGAATVFSDAAEHGELELSLAGRGVSPEIQVCLLDCIGDGESAACQAADEMCNGAAGPAGLAVDFGDTELGPTLERRVWVRNLGDRALQVSAVDLSGGDVGQFSVTGESFALDPEQEQVLTVGYAPGTGGEHTSTLEIASDDVNEGELRIPLSGRALAPRLCPEPLLLDFGNVATGESAVRSFSVTNCGLLELSLDEVALADGTSPDFAVVDPPAGPQALAVGETTDIEVAYNPAAAGSDSGGVDLYSNDPSSDAATGRTGTIALMGSSVPRACDIQATPFAVQFGGVVQGETAEIDLLVSNTGSDDCTLDSTLITENSGQAEFAILEAPAEPTAFGPGESLLVRLAYSPADLGQDTGVLSLFGNDKDSDEIRVDLIGEGIEEPVCDLEIQPTALWFGIVKVYNTKSLVLQLSNRGRAECHIDDVALLDVPIFGHNFEITAMPQVPFVLAPRGLPNAQAAIEVTFSPPQPIMMQATSLEIVTDDPQLDPESIRCTDQNGSIIQGKACIAVTGSAKFSDVEIVPAELDFGVVTLACNSPERCVTVYNLGSTNLTVDEIRLEDPADPNFEIRSAPNLPHQLIAGGSIDICLRYTPQDLRAHRNALVVHVDGDDVLVPVYGRGTDSADQTDVFHQLDQVKADVLFVVDCSGSMSDNQENLATNFGNFIAQALDMDVDFHIGVVATEVENMPGWSGTPPREITPGVLVQAGSRPKILTNATPQLEAAFADNVRLGDDCSNHEAGLEGAWMALSEPLVSDPEANAGFLREDAKLYIIAISDEPDQSNGSTDFYVDFFSSLKGYRNTEMMSVSAICTSCDSDRYWDVTVRTGGICEPIDSVDWAQSLADMGIDAFSAIREFPLSRPADSDSIQVTVDGAAVDRAASAGGPNGWTHYPDTNTLFFGDDVVPERGQRIEVSYTAICY
jgi:hypothetical protein